jgi:hypothetical protein
LLERAGSIEKKLPKGFCLERDKIVNFSDNIVVLYIKLHFIKYKTGPYSCSPRGILKGGAGIRYSK